MNLFTKKADELAAQLTTANTTISELEAKLTEAASEKANLEAKITELEGKLSASETKVTEAEAKVTELEGKLSNQAPEIEKKAHDKAIDIAADAGVPPVTGAIKADSEKEPANFAEYINTLATLEGAAAEAYQAKWLEKLSNKAAQ